MLRLSQALWFAVPALLATACPLYPGSCDHTEDCAFGFTCNASGACVAVVIDTGPSPEQPPRCGTMSCPEGLVCDRYKRCVAPSDDTAGASGAGAGASGAGANGGDSAPAGGAG